MDGDPPLTGGAIEAHIKRLLDEASPGKPYCVLCVAEAFGMISAKESGDIAGALRRVGMYQPARYETVQGRCVTHTEQRGTGTVGMITKQ